MNGSFSSTSGQFHVYRTKIINKIFGGILKSMLTIKVNKKSKLSLILKNKQL